MFNNNANLLNNIYIYKFFIEIFLIFDYFYIVLFYQVLISPVGGENCGVMKSVADMPSCLGVEEHSINIA